MLIKLAVLAACLFACSYGLLNCAHMEARKVNLIYNGTSVHACRNGEEQLEGCILSYSFDTESHVYFVPTKYMIETYEHIWDIYNYTGNRPSNMFEERSRRYEDCAVMLDMILMQHYTHREFDLVLEHFRRAYRAFMPDGKIPQYTVIPGLKDKKKKSDTVGEITGNGIDDDYEQHVEPLLPIYNISLCDIQVVHGDTFLVHWTLSMHYCNRQHHNYTFTACSDTSRPEQNLKCLMPSEEEIEKVELALNESTFVVDKNRTLDNFMMISEVWDAKVPCKETVAEMRKRDWQPKFTECFAETYDDFEVIYDIPAGEVSKLLDQSESDVATTTN